MSCPLFWRQRLRDEVAARLTGATSAGARVYKSRVLPFVTVEPEDADTLLPAINIWVEDADATATASNGFAVEAELGVQAVVHGDDEAAADAALDALSNQIYHALLEEQLSRCTIVRFRDEPVAGLDGALHVALTRMTFTVSFELCIEPGEELDLFEEALLEMDIQPPDGTIDLAVVATPEQPPEEP